jgi:hypothetical protein
MVGTGNSFLSSAERENKNEDMKCHSRQIMVPTPRLSIDGPNDYSMRWHLPHDQPEKFARTLNAFQLNRLPGDFTSYDPGKQFQLLMAICFIFIIVFNAIRKMRKLTGDHVVSWSLP